MADGSSQPIGILLTNTGTPEAPTEAAVKQYLKEFLSDQRIVNLPRWLWQPLLQGLVLPTRAKRSAKLYQKIWTPAGSPMKVIMESIRKKLADRIPAWVEIGMHYGTPSIAEALERLRLHNVKKIVTLPLYPQYSYATTAATYDRLSTGLKTWRDLPERYDVKHYADHPAYIAALAQSVLNSWEKQGQGQHLLISFHGLPKRHIDSGDPYQVHCETTARLLANYLNMKENQWTLCYQSRFGLAKWLKPATYNLLNELPKQGLTHIDIICPGFAVDCLETLEEITIRGTNTFLQAGGRSLRYVPALNDSESHIQLLAEWFFQREPLAAD